MKQIRAIIILWIALLALTPVAAQEPTAAPGKFRFAITSDQRYYSGPGIYDTPDYFRGAVEAIAGLGGFVFLLSPGDIDPVADVYWTITSTLGVDLPWYPVAGNHELPNAGHEPYPGANMDWLRAFDHGPVNPGPAGCPETTFSFDYQSAHFVILNEYCDASGDTATDGDVPDHLYDWLVADLAATDRTHVFVLGHEPAFPQPDADNGRIRHLGGSLDQYPGRRDRFWTLLRDAGVVAYICGHTHNYSAVQIDGVWQVDAGHARGAGDTGAPSTFLTIDVDSSGVRLRAYRDEHDGDYDYDDIIHNLLLRPYRAWLPLIAKSEPEPRIWLPLIGKTTINLPERTTMP